MEKELIIKSNNKKVDIAVLENKKLVELHQQESNQKIVVGDIYLAKIKKLVPGLNAAFLDVGYSKDAFLHYSDLGPKLPSVKKFTNQSISDNKGSWRLDKYDLREEIIKTGRIDEVLNKKSMLLVQVLKEPISTKGPRLTCEITLPGRLLVLVPFSNSISISKKVLDKEERQRLKILVESIKPKNFGVILRTAAEGKKAADFHEELNELVDKWKLMFTALQKGNEVGKVLSELDKTESLLRDLITDDYTRIAVNDKEMYGSIKTFLDHTIPDKAKIVQHYNGKNAIFDSFGITKQIKASFGKTATMNSGAYIVLEHTEAMHVIDVNSGPKVSTQNQQDAVLKVNLEAAEETARQLRLRDIGGLIIIDFIDMRKAEHRKVLYQRMQEFMENDTAQHTILPLSKFGLMQITRQRVRPEVNIKTAEVCPSCNGTGKVTPTLLTIDELERDLEIVMKMRPKSKLEIKIHPFLHAFLKKGFPSRQMNWFMQYKKWIKIHADQNLPINQYKFFDSTGEEIRLTHGK
ncbi:Rne/Rng family ribonuclease [Membranihabitans marinus]|uniref:Rne/Rng family ribonuclease n=1 Tax=Membranihabitans marinus TaxID=1227546 RepID=UPI001F0227DF|nr:Rne/Rng family ribonuclease [Membranihabitans marinus]